MTPAALMFVLLVGNQLAATIVFLGLYGLRSRWRDNPVGRHVMFWSAAAGVLDVSWLLLLIWQQPWLMYLLLAAQALVGLVTWQRVWLVWRAQHSES